MNISLACNLKCEYCSHFGRYAQGIVPFDDLSFWYKSWNHKILPGSIRIMGGEPLLHPALVEIFRMTKNDWIGSRVELITNGLLIPKMTGEFFTSIRENEVSVTVSRHFDDPEYNRLFQPGIDLLRSHGIEPNISQSNWFWTKYYQLNEQGMAVPFQSDPEKAWQNCFVKLNCMTLHDNKLYRCPQLACAAYARKNNRIPKDWDIVLGYPALTPECSHEGLEEFVQHKACPQCSICPETFEYMDMYQKLNGFGLSQLKKAFCGECHESR